MRRLHARVRHRGIVAPQGCGQLLEALAFLHRAEVVHGNVTPENCHFRRRSGGWELRLGGFSHSVPPGSGEPCCVGRARSSADEERSGDHGAGAVLAWDLTRFSAPEMLADALADRRPVRTTAADLWAAGCLIFELLWGEPLIDDGDIPAMLSLAQELEDACRRSFGREGAADEVFPRKPSQDLPASAAAVKLLMFFPLRDNATSAGHRLQ